MYDTYTRTTHVVHQTLPSLAEVGLACETSSQSSYVGESVVKDGLILSYIPTCMTHTHVL